MGGSGQTVPSAGAAFVLGQGGVGSTALPCLPGHGVRDTFWLEGRAGVVLGCLRLPAEGWRYPTCSGMSPPVPGASARFTPLYAVCFPLFCPVQIQLIPQGLLASGSLL